MPRFLSAGESLDRLLRSGWLIGVTAVEPGWKVVSRYGDRTIAVLASTRDQALHFLCQHAEALGFLLTPQDGLR